MATQTQRKSPANKTQQASSEKTEQNDAVVVIPASDYQKLLASLEEFIKKDISSGSKNEDNKIQVGESIEVISLTPGIVNVTTFGGENNGRVYTFRGFGMSMEIPYNDLVNIVQRHFKFFERGYLYVNDARFTKINGLEQITKKVLTKEQMERIVYGDSMEDLQLFQNATAAQKEHMVTMLMDEINEGKDVDMNRIYALSKFVGYDISDRAKQFKEIFEKPE